MNPSAPTPVCRICGASDFRVIHEVPYLGRPGLRRFGLCQACGTVADMAIFDPQHQGSKVDYEWINVRFSVEYGADIAGYAAYLNGFEWLRGQAGYAGPVRFLDVGSAFGFSLALAQARGWQAVGVEPSEFARYGRQYLGVEIIPAFLEQANLPPHSFDCVMSTDVIEHVPNPVQFMDQLTACLKPEGVLLIVTPNSDVLTCGQEPDLIDVLSPGAHLNILSPQALEGVLRRAGYGTIRTSLGGGASDRKVILTFAARQPVDLPAEIPWLEFHQAAHAQAEAYWQAQAARRQQNDLSDILYSGALYHLFAYYYDLRWFDLAHEYAAKIEALLATAGWNVRRMAALPDLECAEYLRQVPAYSGAFYTFRGRMALAEADFAAALEYLSAALRLLEIEKATQIYLRAGWIEQTRLERARAALEAGQPDRALGDFEALLAVPQALPPAGWKTLYARQGLACLRRGQVRQAARWLTRSAQQAPTHPAVQAVLGLAVRLWLKIKPRQE